MKELHQLLIEWRRARAAFVEALANDPEMIGRETAVADDTVIATTGALFEWIDEHLPEWRKV